MTELKNLPIIDWDLNLKLSGNREKAAQEILDFAIARLPQDIATITKFYKEKNDVELLKSVHKLHGALAYCGLPRLKRIVSRLETNLKTNIMSHSSSLLDQLHAEINQLLEYYALLSSPLK